VQPQQQELNGGEEEDAVAGIDALLMTTDVT